MRTTASILALALVHISLASDSTTVVTLAEVLELATSYHPIIRQANLQPDFAEAELRFAKGHLDPKIASDYAVKNLNGSHYYSRLGGSLKVPVWFPLDPKLEIAQNKGDYLNPENYISGAEDFWQVSAGISLPLGKGLFIDERRSLIKQAKLYGQMAEADQVKLSNYALMDIIKAYWDWYSAYQTSLLLERSIQISKTLLDQVKLDLLYGEASQIDTVQATITYQSRLVEYEKAKLELQMMQLELSIHLWADEATPLELSENAQPSSESTFITIPDTSGLQVLLSWSEANHPELRKILAKKSQLEIEERWNKESLKPEWNISYSSIDAPISYDGLQQPEWTDNYKLGMDFSFPIFLRKERGKLQKTQLSIESTEMDYTQKKQEVRAAIRSAYAELKTNERLVNEYEKMAKNYGRVFEAEVLNVENGESDLFKLNIQQEKYLDAQIKYLQSVSKLEKLKAYLPYAAGLPNLRYKALYE